MYFPILEVLPETPQGLFFTVLSCLFEGVQITALDSFTALTTDTLSAQTIVSVLGVMLLSIIGTFVCALILRVRISVVTNFSMAGASVRKWRYCAACSWVI